MTITSHTDSKTARRTYRNLVTAAAIIAGAAALMACSTTEGFGKDVKDLGGGIENSAAKNK